MKTNFDATLYLTNDNERVIARGPIDWQGGTGQCSIAVTITQGNVVATGDTGNYNEHSADWKCNGDTNGGQFQPGQATAHGVITGNANPPIEPWPPQQVTLGVRPSASEPEVPSAPATTPAY